MSCDIDSISEEVASRLYCERCLFKMENKLKMVSNWFTVEHNLNIVQNVFTLLLKQFNLTFEELEKYLNNSVSSVISPKVNLYAFEACSCEKNECKNFIAKKVAISQEIYIL